MIFIERAGIYLALERVACDFLLRMVISIRQFSKGRNFIDAYHDRVQRTCILVLNI